jgi:hypothetical protein
MVGDGASGKSHGVEIAESVGATKQQLVDAILDRMNEGELDMFYCGMIA